MDSCGSMRDDADKTILIRNQQVSGSSPLAGSNIINYLALFSVTRRHKWSVYGQHT